MKTVKEVSEMTGVSIRALHHYDAIELLKPTEVTASGYRLYDDRALERLRKKIIHDYYDCTPEILKGLVGMLRSKGSG